jgi:hypothetical protein
MRALAILLLCAGCSHVTISGSTSPPPSTAAGSAQVTGGGPLALLLIAGVAASSAGENWTEPRAYPNWSALPDWFWSRPPPPLAADREVSEQDCTKPIRFTGNLRCR